MRLIELKIAALLLLLVGPGIAGIISQWVDVSWTWWVIAWTAIPGAVAVWITVWTLRDKAADRRRLEERIAQGKARTQVKREARAKDSEEEEPE